LGHAPSRLERLRRNLGEGAGALARRAVAPLALPRGRPFWLRVRLDGPVPERTRRSALPGRSGPPPLLVVLEALHAAARDPRVEGVLVTLRGAPVSLARGAALRRALAGVRAGGKPVVVYGERLGSEALYLASAADRVFVPEAGSVALLGVRFEAFFVRELLDRLGVRADVVRVGEWKSAAEGLVRRGMSDAQREQLEALAEDLFGVLVEGIAEGRGLAPERVRELVDAGPHRPRAAVEAGLVDACLFPDEVEGELARLAGRPPASGEEPEVRVVEAPAYHALRVRRGALRAPFADAPRVAYVVAAGAIRSGAGTAGVASDAYRALLRRLERDDAVRAVVLRVESPGGDALASDLLWRSVRRLADAKPVVASMGDVAASGGYYVAAAAHAIHAEAATLTGSIGVVGGKLDLEGLFRQVGVAQEGVERGARAGLLAPGRALSPGERAAVRGELRAVYELFLDRVAEGRGLAREAVHAVARGRVWSGRRAQEAGLVDALGGPLEALADARRRAGLADERVPVDVWPRGPTLAGAAAWLLGRALPG
jgi:protease-4